MKIKEFIEKNPDVLSEDGCKLCSMHKKYEERFASVTCPKCNETLFSEKNVHLLEFHAVGSTNATPERCHDEEQIDTFPIIRCHACGGVFACIPKEILYNGNHDIYLTGGREYLAGDIEFQGRLLPHIQQYHERLINGEHLQPWNLAAWLEAEIEHIIAEYLVSQGFKQA